MTEEQMQVCFITAILETPAVFLSVTIRYTTLVMNGDPQQMGLQIWGGLTVQTPCLSDTLTCQPPAQLSTTVDREIFVVKIIYV